MTIWKECGLRNFLFVVLFPLKSSVNHRLSNDFRGHKSKLIRLNSVDSSSEIRRRSRTWINTKCFRRYNCFFELRHGYLKATFVIFKWHIWIHLHGMQTLDTGLQILNTGPSMYFLGTYFQKFAIVLGSSVANHFKKRGNWKSLNFMYLAVFIFSSHV